MSIIKLAPAFKDYLWGGENLKNIYNKKTEMSPVAESWELSTHADGPSTVISGKHAGKTLTEYIKLCGKEILGTNVEKFDMFPILIKFIDAKQALSIQVHPNDEYALEVEKEYGKTEMWYIMDCIPGSFIYYGVEKEMTKKQFESAVQNDTICDYLHRVEVKKGDVFFIPAGTVHAIGAGIMICEIQQNSNTTYRVFDYARRGADGKLRDLHVQKALDVINFSPSPISDTAEAKELQNGANINTIASCKYFTCKIVNSQSLCNFEATKDSFVSLSMLEGSGKIVLDGETLNFAKGDSFFIHAGSEAFSVDGECQFIISTV